MINIGQTFDGRQTWFIRYNPDTYRLNSEKMNPTQFKRHKQLLATLQFCISTPPPIESFVHATWLYYNEFCGEVVDNTVQ